MRLHPYPNVLIVGVGGCGLTDIEAMAGRCQGARCLAVDSAARPDAAPAGWPFLRLPVDPAQAGGAGGCLERGRCAAEAGRDRLAAIVARHDLVFVVGGLGGGTGSALAPLLGGLAQACGIPCFGLFTLPHSFEGPLREGNAATALGLCRAHFDAIALYPNDHSGQRPARRPFHYASQCKLEAVNVILAIVATAAPGNLGLADLQAVCRAGEAIHAQSFELEGLSALARLPRSPARLPFMAAAAHPGHALVQVSLAPRRIRERLQRIETHLSATCCVASRPPGACCRCRNGTAGSRFQWSWVAGMSTDRLKEATTMNRAIPGRRFTWLVMASALTLGGLGLGLHRSWHSPDCIWPWQAIGLGLVALIGSRLAYPRRLRQPMLHDAPRSPWPWLVLAIAIVWLPFLFGLPHNGATRWYGSAPCHIRSGLWGLLALAGFLALYSRQAALGRRQHALACAGLAVFTLALLAQPDAFSILILAALGLSLGFQARNGMRLWLPACALAGLGTLALYLLGSPFRLARLGAFWKLDQTDPLGAGFVLRQSRLAFEQSGLWGLDDRARSGLASMPADLTANAPPYLSLWLGNTATLLAVVLLSALGWAIYRQSRSMPEGASKTFVQAGLLVYAINHVFTLASPIGLLPAVGHYGIAFLGAGEMTLFVLLLSWLAAAPSHDSVA